MHALDHVGAVQHERLVALAGKPAVVLARSARTARASRPCRRRRRRRARRSLSGSRARPLAPMLSAIRRTLRDGSRHRSGRLQPGQADTPVALPVRGHRIKRPNILEPATSRGCTLPAHAQDRARGIHHDTGVSTAHAVQRLARRDCAAGAEQIAGASTTTAALPATEQASRAAEAATPPLMTAIAAVAAARPATRGALGAGPAEALVAVVGLGHAGLPSAIALRRAGFRVVGIETSASSLNDIRSGRVELLGGRSGGPARPARRRGPRARATRIEAVRAADSVLICVPTMVDPQRRPEPGDAAAARARRSCSTRGRVRRSC